MSKIILTEDSAASSAIISSTAVSCGKSTIRKPKVFEARKREKISLLAEFFGALLHLTAAVSRGNVSLDFLLLLHQGKRSDRFLSEGTRA